MIALREAAEILAPRTADRGQPQPRHRIGASAWVRYTHVTAAVREPPTTATAGDGERLRSSVGAYDARAGAVPDSLNASFLRGKRGRRTADPVRAAMAR